jgi:pimeloyl-ACP methyl ester carboxylesterase
MFVTAGLAACAAGSGPALKIAADAGFTVTTATGAGFRHRLMLRGDPAAAAEVWVFIEGDGTPFVAGGREVAIDPSPRTPLALSLATKTPGTVVYVGRPCYFGLASDPGCSSALWTDARYSEAVVASLAAVVRATAPRARVTLVGYSGGGTLATLLAPRLPSVRAVITVAANLDVAGWASLHRYTPLGASLDPARRAPLPPALRALHLVAGRDTAAPPALLGDYFGARPADTVVRFPTFDHVCCWRERWPEILEALAPWLEGTGAAPAELSRNQWLERSRSTALSSGG